MPRYECWTVDDDPDGLEPVTIEAGNERFAAERYAEQRDAREVEYPPATDVRVRDRFGHEFTFTVTLRPEPVYHAKRKE
jgi:hypothetical protein